MKSIYQHLCMFRAKCIVGNIYIYNIECVGLGIEQKYLDTQIIGGF